MTHSRNRKYLCVVVALTLYMLTIQHAGSQDDRSNSRSMVISELGIVAAENPTAARVGIAILERGGNAVDAAIATNAMMGLVAPMSNGIGGDLFVIVYDAKTNKLYGLNASGWSPAKLTIELVKAAGFDKMPQRGIHSVTVPGTVDGWIKLRDRFGSKSLVEILSPAIEYARSGFPVTEIVGDLWKKSEDALRKDEGEAKTYLINGRAPAIGETFRNPDLARTYALIARQGRDAFYKGNIASLILAASKRTGGTLEAADLGTFSSEWVEPISTEYRGWTVWELPPNGHGIAALEMLNMMERYPLKEWGHNSVRALHTMIEAKKLAYADMQRYVSDPAFTKIPVKGILSKKFAQERAKLINSNEANCSVPAGTPTRFGSETTYLSVVDRSGNMVSLIQSNYSSAGFGSGVGVGGAGFTLQNRGALFTLDANHPNALAGGKRPVHTIIPGFMEKGDVRIAFGIMGGWSQGHAHAQFVSNIVDHNMNIQAALEAARFAKRSFDGCDVDIEARVPEKIRVQLTSLGHKINVRGDYAPAVMGAGQAVLRDFASQMNFGASDGRKDGAAVAELKPLLGKF